jgi:YHS domain-containing protein
MKLAAVSAAPASGKSAAEKDPVCGMDVDPKAPNAIHVQHEGKTYYFCSGQCKRAFEADAGKYAHSVAGKRGPA